MFFYLFYFKSSGNFVLLNVRHVRSNSEWTNRKLEVGFRSYIR